MEALQIKRESVVVQEDNLCKIYYYKILVYFNYRCLFVNMVVKVTMQKIIM